MTRHKQSDVPPLWAVLLITPMIVGIIVLIATCMEFFHWGPYR